jgi:hypothetical protein
VASPRGRAAIGSGRARLANGYSAIMPRLFEIDGEFPTAEDVATLQDAGIGHVIVHTDALLGRAYGPKLLANLTERTSWPRQRIDSALVFTVPERTGETHPACPRAPVFRSWYRRPRGAFTSSRLSPTCHAGTDPDHPDSRGALSDGFSSCVLRVAFLSR